MPFTGVHPLTKDPPGYDPENKYKDPVLYYKHKEALVAEEYVKIAQAKVRTLHGLLLSRAGFWRRGSTGNGIIVL